MEEMDLYVEDDINELRGKILIGMSAFTKYLSQKSA